jgi:hypothetical protein
MTSASLHTTLAMRHCLESLSGQSVKFATSLRVKTFSWGEISEAFVMCFEKKQANEVTNHEISGIPAHLNLLSVTVRIAMASLKIPYIFPEPENLMHTLSFSVTLHVTVT